MFEYSNFDIVFFFETNLLFEREQLFKLLRGKNYEFLNEVAFDDYEKGKAIKLDKDGKWYIDPHGRTLRHAKVIFLTHELQRQICKQYINHDPSKLQDKCIEVLLCKPQGLDEWVAISTLRKLSAKCIKSHPLTYAVVPPDIFKKAVMKSEGIPSEEKIVILKAYEKVRSEMLGKPEFQKRVEKLQKEKPIIIKSEKDLIKLVLK
jgi:hypothetical protein